jgi:hypothetical protein
MYKILQPSPDIYHKHQYLFIMQLIIELKRNYSKTIKAALLLKHSNLNIIDIYMKLCHQQATNWSPGQWVDTSKLSSMVQQT